METRRRARTCNNLPITNTVEDIIVDNRRYHTVQARTVHSTTLYRTYGVQ
jgi:hypothetical protein